MALYLGGVFATAVLEELARSGRNIEAQQGLHQSLDANDVSGAYVTAPKRSTETDPGTGYDQVYGGSSTSLWQGPIWPSFYIRAKGESSSLALRVLDASITGDHS